MLYTTYFAALKKLPPNITPVSICAKPPAGFKGLQYTKLAPKYGFFSEWKQNGDNRYYTACFNEQVLAPLNAKRVFAELIALAGSDDVALVCYESPEKFCHRHIVANWFRENNIPIKEFPVP